MKTLMVLLIISGILSVYFVINAEKSILVKGSEVIPMGTDIPKLILNKAKELTSVLTTGSEINNSAGSVINTVQPQITGILQTGAEEVKSKSGNLMSGVISKITDLVKKPIENKISEILCPIK